MEEETACFNQTHHRGTSSKHVITPFQVFKLRCDGPGELALAPDSGVTKAEANGAGRFKAAS